MKTVLPLAALLCGVVPAPCGVAADAGKGAAAGPARGFSLAEFASAFLNQYWLHFELTSVLLLAAVVAAIAVIRANREDHG